MSEQTKTEVIKVPLINANDPESQVSEVNVHSGQQVSKGAVLCILETTKATVEVHAEIEGYIHEVWIKPGQVVEVGESICSIGQTPAASASHEPVGIEADRLANEQPRQSDEIRITEPARKLAEKHDVPLEDLPRDRIVTEALVREIIRRSKPMPAPRLCKVKPALLGSAIVVFGAGGHAKTLIDLLRLTRAYSEIALVDDGLPAGHQLLGIPVLGGRGILPNLLDKGIRLAVIAVGAVERPQMRIDLFQLVSGFGFGFPVIVHPRAVVESSASLADGAQIFATAFVGSGASIGFGAIVNTGAIISHDCAVGDCAHIAPGAILAGGVKVGAGALVGMGVTTNVNICIGEGCKIGNSARVYANVPPRAIVPAGSSWPG